MSETGSQRFDLIKLLKLKELDIRGVAADNEALTEQEYYDALSSFLDIAPAASEALNKITQFADEESDLQSLAAIIDLLTNIGSHEIALDIKDIIGAKKGDDKPMAIFRASRVISEFNALHKFALNARISKKPLASSTDTPEEQVSISLNEALKELDNSEGQRKLRILAVDDTAVMLKSITTLLSGTYEVFSLKKGTLVEKFLHHTTPELFLLDYNMPDMSGFDLVPIIRSFKEHKDTPIIFLTSVGTLDHIKAAISLGACDYVVKPVSANILLEKIAKHIVRKRDF